VNEGPASQSYGLQVAALAGVPETVIKLARKHLIKLEQDSIKKEPQMDLFSYSASEPPIDPDPQQEDHPVIALLQNLAPDELSPRQALEQLYLLKKALGAPDNG
jgi:DNA mismatch repair protein MutS